MTQEQNQGSQFSTALAKVNNTYIPMITDQLEGNGIDMDQYAKQCVLNSISAINKALDEKGLSWQDSQLDQSNITETLLNVASLRLNPSANPSEVFFQVRNVKIKKRDANGKMYDEWKKQIEMGIEGDGNDAILSNFGRDVKQVHQHWLVREQDHFEYPSFVGLEMTPPKWQPTGKGKVIKVVYPIEKKNGVVEYHIAERDDVLKNLLAHINNNLMNETFGIAQDRFKATADQKKKINAKKKGIIERVKELGLDGALDDEDIQQYVSPAWKSDQSRETMIIRKMRNNVVKKIPKDFGSAFAELTYDETVNSDENYRQEIKDNANGEILDVEVVNDDEIEQEQPQQEEPQAQSQSEEVESNEPQQESDEDIYQAVEEEAEQEEQMSLTDEEFEQTAEQPQQTKKRGAPF